MTIFTRRLYCNFFILDFIINMSMSFENTIREIDNEY